MQRFCRIYRAMCSRWGPCHLTLSAWAWKHAQDTGNAWFRNRIDGLFLFWLGQANHCQSCYQRERAKPGN